MNLKIEMESVTPKISTGWKTILLISGMNGLGQFANSVCLPSLPAISEQLGTDISVIQKTLVVYLIFFGIFHLAFGPLSDRYGRKPTIVIGVILFVAGSILSAVATSVISLSVGRAVQAIGASAGAVIGRAVVRDVYAGKEMNKVMATVMMVFVMAAGTSPVIGGLLQASIGWQATFWATAVIGLAVLVPCFMFPESNGSKQRQLNILGVFKGYVSLFTSSTFSVYSIMSGFAAGGLYAFFSGAPDTYIKTFGLSVFQFGFVPAMSAIGFLLGSIIVKKTIDKFSVYQLIIVGATLLPLGSGLIVFSAFSRMAGVILYTIGFFLFAVGTGLVFSIAVAEAIRDFRELAGMANAMVGFIQMFIGAIATLLVSSLKGFLAETAFPVVMFAMASLSLLVMLLFRSRVLRNDR